MISTVLHNATILDGTGGSPYTTDLGIVDDRVALIGDLADRDAAVHLDCTGKIIAPGFIDVHSHSDELWLALPTCDGKIFQGVTTEIGGNCGSSAAPLSILGSERVRRNTAHLGLEVDWRTMDEFFARVERRGVALNVASLVGLGTTRQHISEDSERRLEPDEFEAQARLVREACEQGAIGVSSGLIYPPSMFADSDELVAMSTAARHGGAPLYASHVRNEGDTLVEAIEEALAIGERAQVTVQCSHHKASGKQNWGKVQRTLPLIEKARTSGTPAFCDVYPYIASWTDLATILPPQARFGGVEATLQRLMQPEEAAAIALYLRMKHQDNWHDILITEVGSEANANLAGMRMDEIARARGVAPAWAAIELLREERLDVGAIFFTMNENDVSTVLSASFCCVGSDASIRALSGPTARGVPHPRTFGTFPRVLRRFVQQKATLDMPDAIRRMAALPATIFGLRNRGTIVAGNYADLVVFDKQTVRDTATYERPYSRPAGIEHVFVNGQAVVLHGELTRALPGRVLRHGG